MVEFSVLFDFQAEEPTELTVTTGETVFAYGKCGSVCASGGILGG
jgi:hypothetical protein